MAEIIESIYFRKEDVECCMSFELNEKTTRSFKFKAPLIDSPYFLFNPNEYITPWLQVLNAVYVVQWDRVNTLAFRRTL